MLLSDLGELFSGCSSGLIFGRDYDTFYILLSGGIQVKHQCGIHML